ncbi:hypothetical protein LLG96_04210 [bacterium]|nr:hypothetical protein [bacterium]
MTKNRLVVGDASWADMIPDWLLEEIRHERLIYGLAGISNPDAPKVGDAEVAAYLMTASMRAPMPGEYAEVYVYLTARLMKRQGTELPDFMAEKAKVLKIEKELKNPRKDMKLLALMNDRLDVVKIRNSDRYYQSTMRFFKLFIAFSGDVYASEISRS